MFQAGVDLAALTPLIDRVEDAHKRFASAPVFPDAINKLENEVLVSSVHGTDSIEGGVLSIRETEEAMSLAPEEAKREAQRRIVNLKNAYAMAEGFAIDRWVGRPGEYRDQSFLIIEDMLTDLHKVITEGLQHQRNIPGRYRDNPKEIKTKVGDADHGGVYVPPKCLDDIENLIKVFIEWINSDGVMSLPPLIRAPLAHYYFERIHPFWDGNGRVGRLLEAMILKAAGYKYASKTLSAYYLEHIDEYFTVFNLARKAEEKKETYPNNVFIEFFLKGMLEAINRNHDFLNRIIGLLWYESNLRSSLDKKEINTRQYTIVSNMLAKGHVHRLKDIQMEPWYQSLYKKLTRHTISRDLKGLVEKKLISIDKDKTVRLLIP